MIQRILAAAFAALLFATPALAQVDTVARALAAKAVTSQTAYETSGRIHSSVATLPPSWLWVNPKAADLRSPGEVITRLSSPDPSLSPFIQPLAGRQPTLTADKNLLFNGATQFLVQADPHRFINAVNLPTGSGVPADVGMVGTGLVLMPDGTYVIGNHGRPLEGDASPTNLASIARLSSNRATKLAEVLLTTIAAGANSSAQGLTLVTPTNRLMFTSTGDGKVYTVHSHLSGTFGAFISSFTFASSDDGSGPNALAYDNVSGNVWIVGVTSRRAEEYTLAGVATGRTRELLAPDSPDMMFIDPTYGTEGLLIWTSGGNREPGRYSAMDIASKAITNIWSVNEVASIEGVVVQRQAGLTRFYGNSDSYYHQSPPYKNRIVEFTTAPIPNAPVTTKLMTVVFMFKATSQAVATTPILTSGYAATLGNGISFNLTATNDQLRINWNGQVINGLLTNTTGWQMITAEFWSDEGGIGTHRVKTYINGSNSTQINTTAATTGDIYKAPWQISSTFQGTLSFLGEFGCARAIPNVSDTLRKELEGQVAWDCGRADLLTSTHPWKAFPPSLLVGANDNAVIEGWSNAA